MVYTRVGEGVWGETLKMYMSSLYFRNWNLYFFQGKYRCYLIIYLIIYIFKKGRCSSNLDTHKWPTYKFPIWRIIDHKWKQLILVVNFLFALRVNEIPNKTFILDSHWPFLCSAYCTLLDWQLKIKTRQISSTILNETYSTSTCSLSLVG